MYLDCAQLTKISILLICVSKCTHMIRVRKNNLFLIAGESAFFLTSCGEQEFCIKVSRLLLIIWQLIWCILSRDTAFSSAHLALSLLSLNCTLTNPFYWCLFLLIYLLVSCCHFACRFFICIVSSVFLLVICLY